MNASRRCLPNELSPYERALRCFAISLASTYLFWQAYWLTQGLVPPSLFLALTGWPAPTTGGTRSLQALLSGDWRLSVYHNPMTIPIIVLLLATFSWLLMNGRELRSKSLPRVFVLAWITILSVAWSVKMVQAIFQIGSGPE